MPNAIKEIIEMNKKNNGGLGSAAMPQGSSLPAVTAADNGDVLTVVDGAWDKAAPTGGGGGLLVVKLDNEFNIDKTYADIEAAVAEGDAVIVVNGGMVFKLNGTINAAFEFVSTIFQTASQPKLTVLSIKIDTDNSVSLVGQYQYTLTPAT